MHRILFAIPDVELLRASAGTVIVALVLAGLAAVGVVLYFFLRGLRRSREKRPGFDSASYWEGMIITLATVAVALYFLRKYLLDLRREAGEMVVALKHFEIYTYGPIMALAFLVAFGLLYHIARRRQENIEFYLDLYIFLIIFGLLGAKLLFSLIEIRQWWPDFRHHPLSTIGSLLNCRNGGLVWYGGVLLCIAFLLWYAPKKGMPVLQVTDALAAPLALGLAFGRFACIMGGCCYGKICDLPWAIHYPEGVLPLEEMAKQAGITTPDLTTLRVHPSPLYESLVSFVIFILIYLAIRRQVKMGIPTALWFTLYPLARFFLEFLRGDAARKFLYHGQSFSFSTSQFISLLLLAGAVIIWRHVLKAPPRELVTAEPAPPGREHISSPTASEKIPLSSPGAKSASSKKKDKGGKEG